jgi:hypothetical protein
MGYNLDMALFTEPMRIVGVHLYVTILFLPTDANQKFVRSQQYFIFGNRRRAPDHVFQVVLTQFFKLRPSFYKRYHTIFAHSDQAVVGNHWRARDIATDALLPTYFAVT